MIIDKPASQTQRYSVRIPSASNRGRIQHPKKNKRQRTSIPIKRQIKTPTVSRTTVVYFFSMYQVCKTNVECYKCPDTDNNILGKIRRSFPLQNQNGKGVESDSLKRDSLHSRGDDKGGRGIYQGTV